MTKVTVIAGITNRGDRITIGAWEDHGQARFMVETGCARAMLNERLQKMDCMTDEHWWIETFQVPFFGAVVSHA